MEVAPPPTPEVFAPGTLSRADTYEFGCTITADGRECFFGVQLGDRPEVRMTRWENGTWSEPEVLLGHAVYGYHDPMLSPDENRLYFISNQPLAGIGPAKDSDIWYLERGAGHWSDPIRLDESVNSPHNEYYISFTREGHLYFASNLMADEGQESDYDLYCSRWVDEAFQPAQPLPGEINTGAYEADVFVSPDESWLIVCSTRRSGLGRGDLYVSIRDDEGRWSAARNLGAPINGPGHELCPYLTADGRRLIYTSAENLFEVDIAGLGLPRSNFTLGEHQKRSATGR